MKAFTNNFRLVLLIAFFVWPAKGGFSQEKSEITWHDRLFFGGNLGLQFGPTTQIALTPLIGYRISPSLSAGVGLKYEYYSEDYIDMKFNTSIFGCSVFTSYTFFKNMVANGLGFTIQGEDEILSLERRYFNYAVPADSHSRIFINSILLGGGIKEHLGGRNSMYLLLLWNLTETKHSPYSSPILRFGFIF